jgi:dUTP pyrophosphatase
MIYSYIKSLTNIRFFFDKFKIKQKLKVKLIHPNAKVPFKADSGCAGYDVFSTETVQIYSKTRKLVSTGLSTEFSDRYYLRVAPRSGLSLKGIDIGAGVIDSSYRGEIKVLIINNSDSTYYIENGEKIAQLIMETCESPEIELKLDSLSQTTRGNGGFGSTGN